MNRLGRVVRAWWRRKPLEAAIAEADKLLRQLSTPDAEAVDAEARRGMTTPPAVKLCGQCKWTLRGQCRSPRQHDYHDRVGADYWYSASVIRLHDCHGDWWEAA